MKIKPSISVKAEGATDFPFLVRFIMDVVRMTKKNEVWTEEEKEPLQVSRNTLRQM